MGDLAKRFDEHVVNNMKQEREQIERYWRETPLDTHDEWREINED